MEPTCRIPEQEEAKNRGRHGVPYTTWHRDATLFTPKEQAQLFNGIHGSDAIDYRTWNIGRTATNNVRRRETPAHRMETR